MTGPYANGPGRPAPTGFQGRFRVAVSRLLAPETWRDCRKSSYTVPGASLRAPCSLRGGCLRFRDDRVGRRSLQRLVSGPAGSSDTGLAGYSLRG